MPFSTDKSKVTKSGSIRLYGPIYDQTFGNGVWRTNQCLYRKWEVGRSRSVPRRYSFHGRLGSYSGNYTYISDAVQFCDAHYSDAYASSAIQVTRNKRFARLVDKVYAGDSASMGAFFGEMKDSVRMIAERAEQLASGLRALRKRNVAEAVKIFGTPRKTYKKITDVTYLGLYRKEIWAEMPRFSPRPRKPNPKKRNKTYPELLLEFDYGIVPFVKDIFDFAAVVNGSVVPPFEVEATATTNIPYRSDGWNSQYSVLAVARRLYTARCGGKVSVTNPWLHLAAKMGVVNPAAIAWEIVPFTFFSDQFFNIGQMLDGVTSFAGLSFYDYYETDCLVIEGSYTRTYHGDGKSHTGTYKGVYIDRYPRLTPSLPVAAWRGNPYAENPRDPDSLSKIVRKAVDHLAVCATLLSSAK